MCRILGIVSSKTTLTETYQQVSQMCKILQHGGPDNEGIYQNTDGTVCLGHRRLSILDLSAAGHQPMCSDDKQIWISFNGEIYNFKVLRRELISLGYSFNTNTDTEVILKAYQEWGTQSFSKLKGMFAFALYDERDRQVYLVRDAAGIKPLYFSVNNGDLVFASEIKAFSISDFKFEKDENWKIYLLAFGHIPEPFTTLKGVHSLAKGHYLTWNIADLSYIIKSFKSFSYTKEITDIEEAIFEVKKSLTSSVISHLISDAPIGVFLSGGIDSSILTLIADQYQGTKLNSLSINLQETDYSEKRYQEMVTKTIQGSHNEFFINYKEFIKNFETIVSSMDQPSTDGINSWFVSKYAKENGLKAVLSGLGGDELFGGYPSFQRMDMLSAIKKLPSALIKGTEYHPNHKYKRLYYLSYDNPVGEYLFLRGFFTPPLIASILDADLKEIDSIVNSFPLSKEVSSLSGGNRASWFETNMYMQNQLLKDTDYMSMSHGIEVRVPFLDQDLISTALRIDPKVKFSRQLHKVLLIKAFKDVLPEPVWNRKKMGFSFPFQEWMSRFEQISNPDRYRNKTTKKLIKDFHKGNLHWSSAFALYHINNA
ncbi:asparagine synthase (glutamine-hydrolyzing) [Paradesertivirga mongoliensis]|uniref:asparagine synthase (glutamine-hydrolyzing) n=1 Tax=Paradesertivirga mongoliensis TaxID=2100740 RepID=A0ABW4ZG51_9SPHI